MSNKLLIVAHPDDEVIFSGKELMTSDNWKVICVTNESNKVRKADFIKVMTELHIHDYEIWDFPDYWNGLFNRKELSIRLKKILSENTFEEVLTHNKDGEYGHTQHKALSAIVSELVDKNLYVFGKGRKMINIKYLIKKIKLLLLYKSERHIIFSRMVLEYVIFEKKIKIK